MKPDDFIRTARSLVTQQGAGRPRETDLRRAVSTAYYALFHCVAASGADLLVGGDQSDVLQTIRLAERAVGKFRDAQRKDRTAFVVYMLLDKRSDD